MKLPIPTLLALCSIIGTWAQAQIDINDKKQLSDAQKRIATRLMRYFTPNKYGTIPERESEGPDGFQWFEMGFYWMAVAQYMDVGNDIQYMETFSGALANAAFGQSASFLGGKEAANFSAAAGKWNDDILWWGLAAVHGAEIMGTDYKTPLESTLFDIAKNTYQEVADQWDDQCGGGLYWARNRNDAQVNKRIYKSTITNVEQIIIAVRLYKLTNDRSYLNHAIKVYDWMVGPIAIVTADGAVLDGIYADQRCSQYDRRQHSYNAGLFLGGVALLFEATKDEKYMKTIQTVMGNYEKVFVRDNILVDDCEVEQGLTCKRNQAQFKGPAIFSLMYVYEYASDSQVKNKVKTWIETSAAAMFNTCTREFECSNFWLPDTTDRPYDVHNQMNALFMSNAISSIRSATVEGGKQKPSASEKKAKKNKDSSAAIASVKSWSAILVAAFLL